MTGSGRPRELDQTPFDEVGEVPLGRSRPDTELLLQFATLKFDVVAELIEYPVVPIAQGNISRACGDIRQVRVPAWHRNVPARCPCNFPPVCLCNVTVTAYHKTDERIEAHIFVATLALFLKRTLEHQLAQTLPELSGNDALVAMRSIGLTELDLGGPPQGPGRRQTTGRAERGTVGQTIRLVSGGGQDARRVVKALGIADPSAWLRTGLDPPGVK
ncbi:MAG: hypothetical protein ACE5I3_05265 [Phycisphaerae bacterium]